MNLKCIVIEDEPAAREILHRNILKCPDLECCGLFEDPFTALSFLADHTVDLIFLDINLPGMSGISFLKSLVRPPLVIITTAYPQYAVDGFDLEVADFLLKPFSFERFYKSVSKAREKMAPRKAPPESATIAIKADKRIYQISLDEVLYVEACGDYTSVFCPDRKLITHETLKSWEEKLRGQPFLKIHRSVIINLRRIDHLEGNMAIIGKHQLMVSDPFRDQLIRAMLDRNFTQIG